MALTGLQIQKLLPKTNCKECGSNTCLAFAMKLAGKKAELSECPYASEEAKAILGAASEPPVKTVSVGETKIGGETVLYRHEKTFVNQPIFAVNIDDTDGDYKATLDAAKGYVLERVGEVLTLGAVAVTQKQDDAAKFLEVVKAVADAGCPVIIRITRLPLSEMSAFADLDSPISCHVPPRRVNRRIFFQALPGPMPSVSFIINGIDQ
jgi:CO dehydrogenase/acetyl-CoA synthase gamma subunit (corrinoid Fe-S protein)